MPDGMIEFGIQTVFGRHRIPFCQLTRNHLTLMECKFGGSDKTSIRDNNFGQAAIGILMAGTSNTLGFIGYERSGNTFYENKFGIGSLGNNPYPANKMQ